MSFDLKGLLPLAYALTATVATYLWIGFRFKLGLPF